MRRVKWLIASVGSASINWAQLVSASKGFDIERAEIVRSAALGPLWDHTLCAMLNDLRVDERHASGRWGENHQ